MINESNLGYIAMDIEKAVVGLKNNYQHQLIGNVISEIEWWACFIWKNSCPTSLDKTRINAKVSTNDLCPCRSDKKHKKYCLY
jgi:hypothetical protein